MKRRRRPVKAITMIELGVAGILLLLLVLLVYWYVDGLSAYKPKSEVHQFISGFELEYGEDAVFRENKGDITVNDGDEKKSVVKTPLLYKGETKITIPVDMLLMVPNQGTDVYRINHFTTISENAGKITYSLDNKIAESYGGFLYDGEDLYVFLDDTNLTIGNIDVDLPPLSYVTVRYGQYVEYHNSQTDENRYITITEFSDVTSKSSKGYELNLGNDIFYLEDKEAMLYSAVANVDVIEMK